MENTCKNQPVKKEVISDPPPPGGITQASIVLLAALQQKKIRFAHWKSNGRLLKSLAGGTDLDLLVYPQDRAAFDAVLRQLSYKKLRSQPWSTYPLVEDWIGLDDETGSLLHIHTHYALVTGIRHVKHLYLPWVEEFFQQLQTDAQTGWPVPKPELEALMLLIRIWAKTPPLARLNSRPHLPGYLQDELVGLLQQTQADHLRDMGHKLHLQVPGDIGQRVRKIVAGNDASETIRLAQFLYAQVKPYYRKAWPRALAESFYYKLFLKAASYTNRFLGPVRMGKQLVDGGKIIALIGCDGAGKSSLSHDLLTWLAYKIDTHYFYLGKHPFIKSYSKIIIAKEDLLFQNSFFTRALKKLIGNFYFVILIHKKVVMLQQARKMRRQGSIVLCDRFPQQEIPGLNDGPNLQQVKHTWAARLEQHQFNQVKNSGPDLVFRLQVSPKTASERKPDHDAEQLKMKSESINKFVLPEAVLIDIDTDQPYQQVLLNIKRTIWRYL
jgi:thymidylate kinase